MKKFEWCQGLGEALNAATQAFPQKTVLFYFSGHGMLDPISQEVVLCLQDMQKSQLYRYWLKVAGSFATVRKLFSATAVISTRCLS
jgi:uncharacterized caspase-like protein